MLLAQLPYPIEKDHGKDLHNWLNRRPCRGRPAHRGRHRQRGRRVGKEPKAHRAGNHHRHRRKPRLSTRESTPWRHVRTSISAAGVSFKLWRAPNRPRVSPGPKKHRDCHHAVRQSPRFSRTRRRGIEPAEDDERKRRKSTRRIGSSKGSTPAASGDGIRQLRGRRGDSPILRADGTVLQKPGYDPLTGILFQPKADFPRVAERPSRAEAGQARDGR